MLVSDEAPDARQLIANVRPRSYAVQYRETDLAFVERLLVEEGLGYAFVEDAKAPAGHSLTLFADSAELLEEATSSADPLGQGIRFQRAGATGSPTPSTDQTAHWRKVAYRDGDTWKEGYIDLNATGTTKFSDADFPQWRGWTLVDDDANGDSRCDSAIIRQMVLTDGQSCYSEDQLANRLELPEVQKKQQRVIAKFSTEWEPGTTDKRWNWLKTDQAVTADVLPQPMTTESFALLKKHDDALSFFTGLGIGGTHWHFSPVEFVKLFKRCGWMSLTEMRQTLPRKSKAAGRIQWGQTQTRFETGQVAHRIQIPSNVWLGINQALCCYGIINDLRRAHFLAQVFQEVGAVTFFHEHGGDEYLTKNYERCTPAEAGALWDGSSKLQSKYPDRSDYVTAHVAHIRSRAVRMGNSHAGDGPRFRGRGMLQITWECNYEAYGKFCNKDYTTDPNPVLLQSDAVIAADSAGWYWASGGAHGHDLNRSADTGSSESSVTKVTKDVNGGTNGLANRQEYFTYLWHLFRDAPNAPVHGVTVLQSMQRL